MGSLKFGSQHFSEKDEDFDVNPSGKGALPLASIVLVMVLFGLAMLYSTSSGDLGAKLFVKQLFWAVMGIFCAAAIYTVGYKKLLEYSVYFLIIAAILLIIARLNRPIKGSYRWIRFGDFSLQPSEFAKLALIMFIAHFCAANQKGLNKIKTGILPLAGVCGLIGGLICLGKDLGSTILLLSTCAAMLFVSGLKLRWLFIPVVTLFPSAIFYLRSHDPERWSRVISYTNPEACWQTDGYQLWMSLLALGSGSWTGLGFTQSRMKGMYLPEAHTDFIFSIVGEELGFITLMAIVIGYLIFLFFSISVSIRAADRQGMLLGFGISTLISLQAAINIGVISGALPTKGIPAPFISYGGSNLFVSLCCAGLLLSIAGRKTGDKEDSWGAFRAEGVAHDGG